jgi:hypothetical protein
MYNMSLQTWRLDLSYIMLADYISWGYNIVVLKKTQLTINKEIYIAFLDIDLYFDTFYNQFG